MGSGVGSSKQKMGAAVQLELNSGGRVFFLLFRPPEGVLAGSEGLAVVKFAPSRCATRSYRARLEGRLASKLVRGTAALWANAVAWE